MFIIALKMRVDINYTYRIIHQIKNLFSKVYSVNVNKIKTILSIN